MRSFAVLALLSLAACDLPDGKGGEVDSDGPHCEDVPTDIGMDDPTDLGYTANDVLSRGVYTFSSELRYADDTTTGLDFAFTPGAAARYVTSTAVYPDSGGPQTDMAVLCENRLEIDGVLSFTTEDGRFAEQMDVTLTSSAESGTRIYESLDLPELQGSFDINDFATSHDYTDAAAWLDVSFEELLTSGTLSGQVSGADPCDDGDTCAAWAEMVAIGTFSAAPTE